LATLPSPRKWGAIGGPLLLLFWLGCSLSLVTSQRLGLRLIAAGMINLSFVPLVEIVALFAVWRGTRLMHFSRAVDLFFMGHGPWMIGMLGYAGIWALFTPVQAMAITATRHIAPILLVAALWSGYIDYCFFRYVFNRSGARAGFDLVLERIIAWGLGMIIYGGGVLPSQISGMLRS
jgi:hypothetical protein